MELTLSAQCNLALAFIYLLFYVILGHAYMKNELARNGGRATQRLS